MNYTKAVRYCKERGLDSVTDRTLRREVALERINHFRNGRRIDLTPAGLDKWIQKKTKGPAI